MSTESASTESASAASASELPREQRYRQAGMLYAILGTLVILVTIASPDIIRPELRGELVHAWIGETAILIFAVLIAFGHRIFGGLFRLLFLGAERARRWGEAWQTGLTMLLTFSAMGRTFIFFGNAFGHRPRILRDPLSFTMEAVEPELRFLLCGVFMLGIVAVLIRAAWLPAFRKS